MRTIPLFAAASILALQPALFARGGEGFRGGGFEREETGGEALRENEMREDAVQENEIRREEAERTDADVNIDRSPGGKDVTVDADGRTADADITRTGYDTANVNIRTFDGRDYDANVVGPDGFRPGYVWRNGEYVAVDCAPFAPYVAPYGAWAGWSIITQAAYVQYPVYATYPIETAVEVALQSLGLYSGPIDGLASSCSGAIGSFQAQHDMPVTGTITPELINALGIRATFE